MANETNFNKKVIMFIEDTFQLEKNEAITSIHII